MKPRIALAMPDGIFKKMFREKDVATLKQLGEVVGPVQPNTPEFSDMLAGADYVLTGWGTPKLTPELIAKATKLKMVAHTAGTIKSLISDAVYDRGIVVTTSAGANAVPVAQYTVAMMVSLLKQVPWLSDAYIRGDKAEIDARKAVVRELEDMTLSIIGASRVGREVIRLLKPYPNLTILCYDPYLSEAAARDLGVTKASLDDCCRCELVSIHAPNIPETRHMFNSRTLGLLPDHAVLINTARGALLDEAALVAEVQKRPLYVILDVTDPEPPAADSPLRKQRNILITPHIAGAMNQACKSMGHLAIEEIARHIRGEKPLHAVTREMLATQA